MSSDKNKTTLPAKILFWVKDFLADPKAVALFMIGCSLLIFGLFWFFHTPNRKFEKLCDTIFIKELSEDGLSLHYTLASPEAYGISETDAGLPVYDKTQSLADYYLLVSYMENLEKLDYNGLNEVNKQTYDILMNYLQNEIDAYAFLYYDEPLSPTSGMQNQLPILLAEYAFDSKEDIENYFRLLQSVPAYFEGLAAFEEEKAAQGLFMSDDSCRNTVLQCTAIITEDSLANGSHFLQTSFAERIATLSDDGIITQEEADTYMQTNNDLLIQTVLPAYKSLAGRLTALLGSGTNENGLYYYPEGKEYYEILVERQTGSSKDMDALMTRLKTAFMADYNAFAELFYHIKTEGGSRIFSMSEPDKMLGNLKQCIESDFPAFPGVTDETMPTCQIKKVSDSMEDYLSPAFYLTPPIDNISENVIYINYGTSPENLELYTTLAHEGYPGHLYQSVYSTLALEENGAHPIRSLLHYGGYVEGYATYAELYSYDYATAFGDENYCNLVRLNRKLHLALYSMLDISIHYYGATYEEAHETLCAFGIESPETTREIYDYIVNSPGNYLQYYVGYLEIMECKELARLKWGDNYNDYNFHEFFLDFGPADFETIKDAIRKYDAPKVSQELSLSARATQAGTTSPSRFLRYGWYRGDLPPGQEILPHRQWT